VRLLSGIIRKIQDRIWNWLVEVNQNALYGEVLKEVDSISKEYLCKYCNHKLIARPTGADHADKEFGEDCCICSCKKPAYREEDKRVLRE